MARKAKVAKVEVAPPVVVPYVGKTMHWQRINRRVVHRLWRDLSEGTRYVIANHPDSDEAVWFAKKTEGDTQRLYEDPAYYDNQPATFVASTDVERLEAFGKARQS